MTCHQTLPHIRPWASNHTTTYWMICWTFPWFWHYSWDYCRAKTKEEFCIFSDVTLVSRFFRPIKSIELTVLRPQSAEWGQRPRLEKIIKQCFTANFFWGIGFGCKTHSWIGSTTNKQGCSIMLWPYSSWFYWISYIRVIVLLNAWTKKKFV